MNYRKICEERYGPIPEDWDVHHKDGNKENNHWSNLEPLSKPDHYARHWEQGDWDACHAIAVRMKKTHDEISRLASKSNKDKVEKGVHHWLGGEYQRKTQQRLVKEGSHVWLGSSEHARQRELQKVKEGTHTFQKLNAVMNVIEYVCPCGKVGKGPAMKRWHFDNCKETKWAN